MPESRLNRIVAAITSSVLSGKFDTALATEIEAESNVSVTSGSTTALSLHIIIDKLARTSQLITPVQPLSSSQSATLLRYLSSIVKLVGSDAFRPWYRWLLFNIDKVIDTRGYECLGIIFAQLVVKDPAFRDALYYHYFEMDDKSISSSISSLPSLSSSVGVSRMTESAGRSLTIRTLQHHAMSSPSAAIDSQRIVGGYIRRGGRWVGFAMELIIALSSRLGPQWMNYTDVLSLAKDIVDVVCRGESGAAASDVAAMMELTLESSITDSVSSPATSNVAQEQYVPLSATAVSLCSRVLCIIVPALDVRGELDDLWDRVMDMLVVAVTLCDSNEKMISQSSPSIVCRRAITNFISILYHLRPIRFISFIRKMRLNAEKQKVDSKDYSTNQDVALLFCRRMEIPLSRLSLAPSLLFLERKGNDNIENGIIWSWENYMKGLGHDFSAWIPSPTSLVSCSCIFDHDPESQNNNSSDNNNDSNNSELKAILVDGKMSIHERYPWLSNRLLTRQVILDMQEIIEKGMFSDEEPVTVWPSELSSSPLATSIFILRNELLYERYNNKHLSETARSMGRKADARADPIVSRMTEEISSLTKKLQVANNERDVLLSVAREREATLESQQSWLLELQTTLHHQATELESYRHSLTSTNQLSQWRDLLRNLLSVDQDEKGKKLFLAESELSVLNSALDNHKHDRQVLNSTCERLAAWEQYYIVSGPACKESLSARDHMVATMTESLRNSESRVATLESCITEAHLAIRGQQQTIAAQSVEIEEIKRMMSESKTSMAVVMQALSDKYHSVKAINSILETRVSSLCTNIERLQWEEERRTKVRQSPSVNEDVSQASSLPSSSPQREK